jgi:hypothetical protein
MVGEAGAGNDKSISKDGFVYLKKMKPPLEEEEDNDLDAAELKMLKQLMQLSTDTSMATAAVDPQ